MPKIFITTVILGYVTLMLGFILADTILGGSTVFGYIAYIGLGVVAVFYIVSMVAMFWHEHSIKVAKRKITINK